ARRAARCPGAPASVRSPRTDRTLTRTPRLRGRRAYGYAAPTHCAASPARRPSSSSAPVEGSASIEGSLPVEGAAPIEGSPPVECLVRGVLAPAEALELHTRWSAVRSVRSEPAGRPCPSELCRGAVVVRAPALLWRRELSGADEQAVGDG